MKLSLLLLFVLACVFPAFAAKQYSYYRVGNPNDVATATTAGAALEGGGTRTFRRPRRRAGAHDEVPGRRPARRPFDALARRVLLLGGATRHHDLL